MKTLTFLSIILIFSLNAVKAQKWHIEDSLIHYANFKERDFTGNTVYIDNDYAIVGAMYEGYGAGYHFWDNRKGAAYIFKRIYQGKWVLTQKLSAFDGKTGDLFGNSTVIEGNYAFVGAPQNSYDSYGNNKIKYSGAVYVFIRDSGEVWHLSRKLVSSDRQYNDMFGQAVAIQNQELFVGCINGNNCSDIMKRNSGAVHIYSLQSNGNWILKQKLTPAGSVTTGSLFGYSIDVKGGQLIIGAPNKSNGLNSGTKLGAAAIYTKTASGQWIFKQWLSASDPINDSHFGKAVSISDSVAIVGAPDQKYLDSASSRWIKYLGEVYVFQHDSNGNWQEVKRIIQHNKYDYQFFGTAVENSDRQIFIGSPFDQTDSTLSSYYGSGSIFQYTKNNQGKWTYNGKIKPQHHTAYNYYLGYSISLDSNELICGMPGFSEPDSITGYDITLKGGALIFNLNKTNTSIQNRTTDVIKYYPNPVAGILNILLEKYGNHIIVNQYDIGGRLIKSKQYSSEKMLSFTTVGKHGIYFIEVKSDTNPACVFRIIKK